MAMTKKDYEGMAQVINNALKSDSDVLTELGEYFADKNPRFNMDKWLDACVAGVDVSVGRVPTGDDVGKRVRAVGDNFEEGLWEVGDVGEIIFYESAHEEQSLEVRFKGDRHQEWWVCPSDLVLID